MGLSKVETDRWGGLPLTILLASHDSLVDEYVDRALHLEDGQIRD